MATETYNTVTGRQVLTASNATGVPTYIIASVYKSGYQGDVNALARNLRQWMSATGGTSWVNALAAYHAGSVRGSLASSTADQTYARNVLREKVPSIGAMSTGAALALAGIVAAAAAAPAAALGEGAAGVAATEGATGAGGAAEGGTAGGAAGTGASVAGKAISDARKAVEAGGTAAFLSKLTSGGTWLRVLEFIGGLVLIIFALFMFGRVVENTSGGQTKTRIVPV